MAAAEAGWAGRMWVEVVEAWCIVELADDSGRGEKISISFTLLLLHLYNSILLLQLSRLVAN